MTDEKISRAEKEITLNDKYAIRYDRYCFWIEERKTASNGKEYRSRVTGYLPTAGALATEFAKMRMKDIKAEDAKTALTELADMEEKILSEVRDIVLKCGESEECAAYLS